MNFVIDQLQLLGLNEREMRVFTTLSTFGRMNMTTIARRSNLPRTTVDAIVRRLRKQGLLEQHVVGRHYEWSVDLNEVRENLAALEAKLAPQSAISIPERPKFGTLESLRHDNLDAMLESLRDILSGYKDETVRVLQGSVVDACAREEEYFHRIFPLLGQRQLRTESIAARSVLRLIARLSDHELREFEHVDATLVLVPDTTIPADEELILLRDIAIAIDLEEKTMTLVDAPESISVLHSLFSIASTAGERIELTAYIRGLIEERQMT